MNVKVTIRVEYEDNPGSETRAVLIVRGDELCPDCLKKQVLDSLGGLDVVIMENETPYHYTPADLRALMVWGRGKNDSTH